MTDGRFSIEERTALYLAATREASLGWLVDFVASAKADYHERENGPQREESCLTTEAAVPELVNRALQSIRTAAEDGSLLHHVDAIYILYRWRDFAGDPAEVRTWTDSLLENEEALVTLADKLTGESWSFGMGSFGLGDRIAMRSIRANVNDDIDILNTHAFKTNLERLRSSDTLDDESKTKVSTFLEAWSRKKEGFND